MSYVDEVLAVVQKKNADQPEVFTGSNRGT